MRIVTDEKDLKEYKDFLENHERCNFQQSPEWAKVKSNWKNEIVLAENEEGNIIEQSWEQEALDIEDVYNYNSIKLSNYIDKITNHGLKGTTGKYNIISSRGDYAFTDILKEYRLNDKIEKNVSMKENYDIW